MKFSIIVSVYNVEAYLEKCLNSLLCQAAVGFEIILVDDGSTDSSGSICDSFAAENPELIRVIHQMNQGVGAARNTGISAARGEYLIFVDGDDYVAPSMLSTLFNNLEAEPCDILSFNFISVTRGKLEQHNYKLPAKKSLRLRDMPQLFFVESNVWSRAWRRSFLQESGIRFPARAWYEDLRVCLKLFALADNIRAIDDALYYYVRHEGSIMHNKNIGRNAEIIDAVDDIVSWYKDHGLFEEFRLELTRIAIDNLYIAASVRVLLADLRHPLLQELRDYMKQSFPDYRENPYINLMSQKQKFLFRLIENRQYLVLRILLNVKGLLFGKNL